MCLLRWIVRRIRLCNTGLGILINAGPVMSGLAFLRIKAAGFFCGVSGVGLSVVCPDTALHSQLTRRDPSESFGNKMKMLPTGSYRYGQVQKESIVTC